MQNYCKTIGALAAASALVAGNASAEVEYTLGTGYTSEYIFRGENLGEDLVEASLSAILHDFLNQFATPAFTSKRSVNVNARQPGR
mgnify:CR=1 FL=1